MKNKDLKNPWQAKNLSTWRDFTPNALYLHLPFCFHKCHYCDFFSVIEKKTGNSHLAFTKALIAQIEAWQAHLTLKPSTIFIGGGTPTLLAIDCWEMLLQSMKTGGLLNNVQEWTVEANPETLTPELLALLADFGVNRLSIGAQSFQAESLKMLERWHKPENVAKSVGMARAAGIHRISLDLIFGIPGQTVKDMAQDLNTALDLQPSHLSTYGLTYEPQTALTARLKSGRIHKIDEDTERVMYETLQETLINRGYDHYEISNWARSDDDNGCSFGQPSHKLSAEHSQHNHTYWRNGNWLGLGPSAGSHLEGFRWKWKAQLTDFVQQQPWPTVEDEEHLPNHRAWAEWLLLGLRLRQGICLEELANALSENHKSTQRREQALDELKQWGLLASNATRLYLTRKGLMVADSVLAHLL